MDPDCCRTTKVLGLLGKVQTLDTGRPVYSNNYYSSPKLLKEFIYRKEMVVVLSEVKEKIYQKLS